MNQKSEKGTALVGGSSEDQATPPLESHVSRIVAIVWYGAITVAICGGVLPETSLECVLTQDQGKERVVAEIKAAAGNVGPREDDSIAQVDTLMAELTASHALLQEQAKKSFSALQQLLKQREEVRFPPYLLLLLLLLLLFTCLLVCLSSSPGAPG